ncbi:transcriptional regulator [Streptomyces roseoverticillatus]|uniref:transcriptional regulator n=1 Tax=Streptomyces roseoverticillatus TaxID=66429 RepID=UPI000B2E659A|nr:transcriptional regulator [Streptomyces roseoverticillatus]
MTAPGPAGPISPAASPAAPAETAGRTLDRLASERATGALHGCAGALYLADGAVVHAESPAVPDLGRRLTARGRLSPQAWEEAVAEGGPGYRAGSLLVERGRLSRGELELCHLSALFDAAYFVLSPLDPAQRAPDRFLGEARHWLGPIRPVPVPLLRREVVRRRRLLERAWPRPEVDAAPVVRTCGGERAGPAGAGGRRAVLAAADGVRTPVQIARALGRSAFATLFDVRRLAAAGLVRTPCADAPAAPGPPPPAALELSLLYRIRDALEAL